MYSISSSLKSNSSQKSKIELISAPFSKWHNTNVKNVFLAKQFLEVSSFLFETIKNKFAHLNYFFNELLV